jgi:hypothetical protein
VEGLADTKPSVVLNSARVVKEHLLKLQYSPARDPRNGWRASVREHRRRIETDLTPRIAQIFADELPRLYRVAREDAQAGMRDTASTTRPTRCPGPLPTVWIRSPATGGREAGTRLSRSAALAFRRIAPSGTDSAARPARRS